MKKIEIKITFFSVLLFTIYLCIISCNLGVSNTILEQVISPDEQYTIYVFTRDAGATTGFNTQVSIKKNRELLKNKEGNTFICDLNHISVGNEKKYAQGGPKLSLNWITNNDLAIYYPKGIRIYKQESTIYTIKIKYYEDQES